MKALSSLAVRGATLYAAVALVLVIAQRAAGDIITSGDSSPAINTQSTFSTDGVVVGNSGSGVLSISVNTLWSGSGIVAAQAGVSGVVTVSAGAWGLSGGLDVGYQGVGTLTLDAGGKVSSDFARLGTLPNGGSGTLNISGVDYAR